MYTEKNIWLIQSLVRWTKEFSYYAINQIFGCFNQRNCLIWPEMVFLYDLVKWKKYFSLFNKIVLLDQVNFFLGAEVQLIKIVQVVNYQILLNIAHFKEPFHRGSFKWSKQTPGCDSYETS